MTKIVMHVHRGSETYAVDEAGNIGRPRIGMEPSGAWKFLGIIAYNNYGTQIEFISFVRLRDPDILASINWHYKNGKCRYHGVDMDHGTQRVWMMPDDLQSITLAD